MPGKILLIDGHSMLNRAFYGIPHLSNSKGVPTNAVYGFLNIMFKVIDDESPDHIAVAFDVHAPTFRHEIYKEYKGTRKPMPDDLRPQVPLIKEVLQRMNISIIERAGFEADDIIGTLAKRSAAEGIEAVILSGDRDLLQLVGEGITLRLPKTSKGVTTVEMFTSGRVKEVYGVEPGQIVDMKALMGDTSDNIPGLPGVGEKTAAAILEQYGTLENARAHADELKPKVRAAFEEHYDLALLSARLATIKTDVEIDADTESFRMPNMYNAEAYAIFKELEFRHYLERFKKEELPENELPEMKEIAHTEELKELTEQAVKNGECGFYAVVKEDSLKALAVALEDRIYLAREGNGISPEELDNTLKALAEGCESPSTIGLKEQLKAADIPEKEGLIDLKIAAYLLNPLSSAYGYEEISAAYAGRTLPGIPMLAQDPKAKEEILSDELLLKLAGLKAFAALESRKKAVEMLSGQGMLKLLYEVEMPLVFTLSEMEKAGIRMDTEALKDYGADLEKAIEEEEKTIYALAGEEFNIQSPKQLEVILFEKMKLKGGKKTKTGYSTAADVLEKLAQTAPIAAHVLSYRQLAKLKSTYADTLGTFVKADGRIHSNFHQTITATGRISSTEPNLQNIPVRVELGKQIRKVFLPADGCVFIDADYSQIELRVLAHLSDDDRLIEAYQQDRDIHRITASEVFKVPLSEVTPQMRHNAKAVNFGIVYGISSFGLSQGLNISRKEAAGYIEQYFRTYPGVKKYLDDRVAEAKEKGYTVTLYGRRRPIPELRSANFARRAFGERVAMNSPIQGTAADIIKIAMNRVRKRLASEGMKTKLILQVHDELLLEAPEEEREKAAIILREEMENAVSLRVRIEVEVSEGVNWYEVH